MKTAPAAGRGGRGPPKVKARGPPRRCARRPGRACPRRRATRPVRPRGGAADANRADGRRAKEAPGSGRRLLRRPAGRTARSGGGPGPGGDSTVPLDGARTTNTASGRGATPRHRRRQRAAPDPAAPLARRAALRAASRIGAGQRWGRRCRRLPPAPRVAGHRGPGPHRSERLGPGSATRNPAGRVWDPGGPRPLRARARFRRVRSDPFQRA